MAGQETWNNAGSATNAYVVNPELESRIYYESTYRALFGKLNEGREVTTVRITYGDDVKVIDSGNSSPVWEKKFTQGNEVRFTMREENKGMATYGPADVGSGDFAKYYHCETFVRQVDSPAYPIVDAESEQLIKAVIPDLVKVEKDNIAVWRGKEVDLDAFRTIFMGASRGLLDTTNGGMGMTLYNATAGAQRSCYNNVLASGTSLITPSVTVATHEASLSTALATMSDDDAYAMTYAAHRKGSEFITALNFKPVKYAGEEFRALAITDPRNMDRLFSADTTLEGKFRYATERSMKNKSLYRMKAVMLDDILYIPASQIAFFRPTADGSTVAYGAANTSDPRSDAFSNSSNICPTIYMGAGALLRGRRKNVNVTADYGRHGKSASYCVHYQDGWVRREWGTQDDRTKMKNDSMLIMWAYDPGVGVTYQA